MQLPPDEALVLISGLPPIRAKIARYFADPQLACRILQPPIAARTKEPRPDSLWHTLPKPAMAPDPDEQAGSQEESRSFAPLERQDNWEAEQRHADTKPVEPDIAKHIPAALREAEDLGFPT